MKITLDITKTVEENASMYFEKAKKAKKKIAGVEETLKTFKAKQEKVLSEDIEITSSIKKLADVKKHWYEKFRWFVTSEGYLVIGGRDATTNEIVVKKHLDKDDLVFHTDMAGSPFVVIKKDEELPGIQRKELTQKSIEEAASFTLIHSRIWKNGLSSGKVFWVKPEQVSKTAEGSLAKGSFMIYGKTTYVDTDMKPAAGIIEVGDEQVFMVAPLSTFSGSAIEIEQGKEKASAIAKQIRSKLFKEQEIDVHVDIIIRGLPQGCQLKKVRKRKHEL